MASDHVFQGGYLSALRDLMHAYSNFSAVFSLISALLFAALDVASDRAASGTKTRATQQSLMKRVGDLPDYSTFSELLGNGTQLEHFHVYFPVRQHFPKRGNLWLKF